MPLANTLRSQPKLAKLLRNDPSQGYKDIGYFGPLDIASGPEGAGKATEYSVGVEINGKEMDIPTLVPGLTQQELDAMTKDIIPNRKPIPRSIIEKAVAHAKMRIAKGLSPFFNADLEGEPPMRPPMAGE